MKNQRVTYNAYSARSRKTLLFPHPTHKASEKLKIKTNYNQNFSYIFYTDIDAKAPYKAIQFKKLHPEQNIYSFILSTPQMDKRTVNSFITDTYTHSDDPSGTIAQIIVDFMISQPDIRLIVDNDPNFFKGLLSELWAEFNGLFEIKGLLNGHWEICKNQIEYDAYSLIKLL